MRRVLLPFVISLFLPLQVFSTPCERVAFATGGGFAVVRSFESKIDFVTLIERYNPQFDLQLKKEGYSRDQFRRLINSNNRSLVFLKNFFWGKVYGENKFFVVELRSYFMDRSSPLIGRVIRKISQSRALVEVVTVSGDLKRVEVEIEAAFKFDYYDEGNIDIFNLGFKVFMRSSDFDIRVQQGNSRLEMVF